MHFPYIHRLYLARHCAVISHAFHTLHKSQKPRTLRKISQILAVSLLLCYGALSCLQANPIKPLNMIAPIKPFAQSIPIPPMKIPSKSLDIDNDREGWLIDLTRISINFTSTKISNEENYKQFGNSRISGDSQVIMQFYGYALADYYAKKFVFFNSLLAEYGDTMVFISPQKRLKNKTLDRILFSTGYTQRLWDLDRIGGGEIGPYVQLSLQSEFTPSANLTYRKKFFRYAAGVRLFDGRYIENLKLNLFGEEDFSDISRPIESMGAETGFSLKYALRDGVWISSLLNYRYYIFNNYPKLRSPEHELECNLRLDTTLWGNFTISPFVSFYLLQGLYIDKPASNVFIGVSLGYGKVIKDNKISQTTN